jgi:hypothetical protein
MVDKVLSTTPAMVSLEKVTGNQLEICGGVALTPLEDVVLVVSAPARMQVYSKVSAVLAPSDSGTPRYTVIVTATDRDDPSADE